MLKASPKNILVNHPSYGKILHIYNETLKNEGKVNSLKFFREVVSPEIPGYGQDSWYAFLKRFKTNVGIIAVEPKKGQTSNLQSVQLPSAELAKTMLSNSLATSKFVSSILNISAEKAEEIVKDPNILSPKEAIELGIKIMKAQDSRIHAVGKLREDSREQERFERAFDSASFGSE